MEQIMPTIARIRIINFNFNDGDRFGDETYEIAPHTTKFHAANGFGKSVLDQVIMSPFVSEKKRDRIGRPFISHFTSGVPSYVMIEWLLENGNKLITGALFQKKDPVYQDSAQNNEEQQKPKLITIHFVGEYDHGCPYRLDNIPLVRIKENGAKVPVTFSAAKALVAEYSRAYRTKFSDYDMSREATAYWKRLKTYGISRMVWESIIYPVNLEEESLSKFFTSDEKNSGSNSDTTRKFMSKWVISVADAKLNENDDKHGILRQGISEYINTFIKYKEEYRECEAYEEYRGKLDNEVKPLIDQWESKVKELNFAASRLTLVKINLKNLQDKTSKRMDELVEELASLREQKNHAFYGILSEEYYMRYNEAENAKKAMEALREKVSAMQDRLAAAERELRTATLYELFKELDSISSECAELIAAIEIKEKTEKENRDERRRIGTILYGHYKSEAAAAKEKQEATRNKLENVKQEIKEKGNEIKALKADIREAEQALRIANANVDRYTTNETAYNTTFEADLTRNCITGEYPQDVIAHEREKVSRLLNEAQESVNEANKAKLEAEDHARRLDAYRSELQDERTVKQSELKNAKTRDYELTKMLVRRADDLKILELNPQHMYDEEKIAACFLEKIAGKDIQIQTAQAKRAIAENEVNELEGILNGEPLSVPAALIQEMTEAGLHVVTGLQLMNAKADQGERLAMLHRHPELPYAIVVNRAELNNLQQFRGREHPKYAIPLVIRDTLDKDTDEHLLYTDFDERLLNRQAVEDLLNETRQTIALLNEQIKAAQTDRDTYINRHSTLLANRFTKDDVDSTKRLIKDISERLTVLGDTIAKTNAEIKNEKDKALDAGNMLIGANTQLFSANERVRRLVNLLSEYETSYITNKNKAASLMNKVSELTAQKERAEDELEGLNDKLRSTKNTLDEVIRLTESLVRNAERFAAFGEDVVCTPLEAGPLEEHLARYRALESMSSDELQVLQDKHQRKTDALSEKRRRIETELGVYGQSEPEVRAYAYDSHRVSELFETIKDLTEKRDALQEEERQAELRENTLRTNATEKLSRIKTETKHVEPMSLDELTTINPKDMHRTTALKINEQENAYKSVEKRNSLYGTLLSALVVPEGSNANDATLDFDPEQLGSKELSNAVKEVTLEHAKKAREAQATEKAVKDKIDLIGSEPPCTKEMSCARANKSLRESIQLNVESALEAVSVLSQKFGDLIESIRHNIEGDAEERSILSDRLCDYIRSLYRNIRRIDQKSTIEVNGTRRKMFEIRQPLWDEDDNIIYRSKCAHLIDRLIDNVADIEDDKNRERAIAGSLTPDVLYDEIIGIANVKITIYKVEESRIRKLNWKEIIANSGGEGTLSAFIVLTNFMYFLNSDPSDIFATKREQRHVLILDNPFAKMTSGHLLKPFFDIAKQTGTQLVIFSGVMEKDVNGPFERIFTLEKCPQGDKNAVYTRSVEDSGFLAPLEVEHNEISDYQYTISDMANRMSVNSNV